MSENFLRTKRDMLKDIADISHHTQESWAEIMLRHSQFLKTEEDQKSFWNFILNPTDERGYVSPAFFKYDPEKVVIPQFQKLSIPSENEEKCAEITLKNTETRNGLISYIRVTQVE